MIKLGEMNSMMTALYVCDLDPKVTESMIVEKFSSAGHVHSVRLCRDRKTGSSLGYAFVNFKHRADAERAVKMLNSQPLMKRPMRVMWSVRNSCVGKLIVKNLDWSIDDAALFDAFSVFGKILSCKVATNEKGSKGFGFVQFETEEAANRAMKKLNGKLLHKRKVFIELFKPREERRAEEQNPKLVNAGQAQTKQEEQTQHNNKSKQVKTENGRSKGFGFVCFASPTDAMKAKQEIDGRIWGRKNVHVDVVQHKEERQASLPHKTNGTVKPSTRQMPHAVPVVDSVPAVNTVPVVDSVPVVDTVPVVDSVPVVDTVPVVDSVPVVDTVPVVDSVPVVDTVPVVDSVPVVDTVPVVDSVPPVDTVPVVDSVPASSQDVPTYLPAGKRLTIYILESAALEDQIQMAHDYLLPLVEKIHPTQANQITWMLVQAENNYNIMDMIGDPELLRAKVDKMDRLLKAREAGVKPEKLKMLFGDLSKKKRRKKRKNK
ncbi:polyadenylate-binding protein 1-like [Hemibagrus wyckioides]|uniref:polyadenylate-binding protein 1-like n=1 Tax=Hemibagrus wyckioides TaxID=337641 RepID=UPI00266CA352|nr:polyadenylate-binding protein 1-like [Hemibagrus wyckioides]